MKKLDALKNIKALEKAKRLKQDLREWKEAQDTTRLLCTIASAVVSAASVALVVDYASKKKKDQDSATPLVLGVLGLVTSAVVAGIPDYLSAKKLMVEDMLNDDEADLMDENISEVLNYTADQKKKADHMQQIELDEDTTIEDFIFD